MLGNMMTEPLLISGILEHAIQNNSKSKLHSVYVSGYVLTLRDNILKNSRSNMGVSLSLIHI